MIFTKFLVISCMNSSAPMIPFLRSVAMEIVSLYGSDLHDFCFVLPGKRATLFLNKYLSEIIRIRAGRQAMRRAPNDDDSGRIH